MVRGLLAATLLGACHASGPAGWPGAGDGPILDAHVHTRFDGQPERSSGIPYTRQELLRQMHAAGVVAAIAHTDEDGGGYSDMAADCVLHCAGIGARVDVARIEEGLRRGQYRCIKIYLGYVHQFAHDPAYEPAYQLAQKYDVPVVFHTGDTYSHRAKLKYADPLTVDEVAVDHPRVRFVLAHAGNPWFQSAAEVAYKNPNVYLDGSALVIGRLHEIPRSVLDSYLVRPLAWVFGYLEDPSKLLYGSDWPLVDMAAYAAAFRRAIPKEHWRAVLYDNAARLFRLGAPGQAPANCTLSKTRVGVRRAE